MKRKLQFIALTLATSLLGCFSARAQTPGGVAPAVWYKAGSSVYSDAGATAAANNGTVQQWNDQSGNARHMVQATSGSRPVYSNATTLANFNPTLTFDGINDWMQFTAGIGVNVIDRANGTLYAAGLINKQKGSGFLGFHASMDYPGLHFYSNYKLLLFTGGPGYQGLSNEVLPAQSFFTAGSGWQNGGGTPAASYAAATVSQNGIRVDYTGSQLLNANLDPNARDLRIGADNNYGAFDGQLNEILVYEDKLTAAQMDQVESYMAIKYGTTYANGGKDYKNSTGGTVWNATTNVGYNSNIAGIANDGALYQKQSWSTNTGKQVLIGVGGLANTNAANSGTITAGRYLVWADNGAKKLPTVATSSFSGINHHFAAIWKVQNNGVGTVRVAWPKNFSNLTLIQSGDATIDGSDVATNMSTNEVTINDVVYNYADVTLSSGQYFTFGAFIQAPGGVINALTQWYRADKNVAAPGGAGTDVTTWTDFAMGVTSSQINNAPLPKLKQGATNYFNFNPGVQFTEINQMIGNISEPTLSDVNFDIFTFTKEGMTDTRFFNIGMDNTTFNGVNWDQPGFYANGNIASRNNTGGGTVIANPGNTNFTAGTPSIMYHSFTNLNFTKGLNGAATATPSTYPARGLATGGHMFGANGGVNPPGGDDWGFKGDIGEVIVYGAGNLSAAERNKVDSYLAIKYGITLNKSNNYVNAQDVTVWDATANSAYYNNVAGITNDNLSALDQKQSISVNAGQQVLIGTTGLANTNAENATGLTDGLFLVWGDNGLAKALSSPFSGDPSLNLRFAAIWKVQNTGSVGTVRVAWPSGISALTLVQSGDAVFDGTDTRTNMTGNTQTINGVSYNYADVTLGDGQYFTFAGYVAGPGGVGQDLSLWYRADNGVETDASKKVTGWNNSTGNDVKLTMSGATGYIPYNDQTTYAKTWNFNPTLSFDGTNNYLSNTTTPYLNTAGSVHYITVARLNASALGYNSIFAIAGNDDGFFLYPQSGLLYPMPAIGNGFGATAAGPGSENRFGIYSAILPKTGSPANQRGFYNGLQKVYTAPYPLTGSFYSLPTTGAYLGADGTTADNPNGDIAEVILYHGPTGDDMANADLAKIHSYLAIKYGITLDQTTAQNYINSASGVVWDATINAGYQYNIAGIARDDEGSLYQKQSWSVNSGRQVLISTTGLANTNVANTAVLSNNQFLIWGDNNLAKAPTVAIIGITEVNNRFAAIWKVQNTGLVGTVRIAWPAGFTNLKLIQSTDETINASDVITDMSGTQTVNGADYAYADVTISDGQYFTFAAFVQGPGGVTTGLSHWYRADKFADATGDGADVNSWTDFTSGVVSSQLGTADLPKFKQGDATYFNFNPGLNFTATTQTLGNIDVQTLSSLNFDIFTLTKESMSGIRFFNIGMNNTTLNGLNWDQPGFYADGGIVRRTNTGAGNYLANPGGIGFSTTNPSIMYHTFGNTTLSKGLNGAPNGTTASHAAIGPVTGGHMFGANYLGGAGGDDAGFVGNIGELVIYGNGTITAPERNKVDSYLAIKYGVTLNNSNNYTTSQNAVVWDATANAGFYNNVAGIGNDFLSALHQKQSRSQHANTNNQVIIGLGDIAATNAANPNALTNGDFLLWGDNGNTQAMNAAFTPLTYAGNTDSRRMNRIWKVQNTSVSQEVLIRFPVASVGTTTLANNDPCAGYAIIFASDAAFTSNITVKPLTVNGTDYDALHTFPNGASYFTYGKVTPVSVGAVYLPGVVETTSVYGTCGTGEWTYYHKTTEATANLIALSGYTTAQMDNLTVTITPEGTEFDNGSMQTKLMPRITTVADGNTAPLPIGKVRIYYSQAEMDQTTVTGAVKNGWYKYEGDVEAIITDVFADGFLNSAIAVEIVPSATGEEDGVRYAEFDDITSFSSFVYISTTEASPLPVTLAYFNAARSENKAVLSWTTTNETNSKSFEIERSADAKNWTTIGQVTSAGESVSENTYNYDDLSPLPGINYYRLKMIDLDNTFAYSSIRSVRMDEAAGVVLYPNPVSSRLFFKDLKVEITSKVLVYDHSGRVRVEVNGIPAEGINISGLPAGIYVVVLKMRDGSVSRHKITVQNESR